MILQSLAGDINVPIPGWGVWDLDGNLYTGHINVDSKVGYQTRPTNYLDIKPETLALLGQNPEFRKARSIVFCRCLFAASDYRVPAICRLCLFDRTLTTQVYF